MDDLDRIYNEARSEHAWLLRAEGKTFDQIGERLGVTRTRIIQMTRKFVRRVGRAMRKVRWPKWIEIKIWDQRRMIRKHGEKGMFYRVWGRL